ncbi:ABC transporter permease [Humidisolicoccus flavus]|uniref:ABC transporter permease n=1 Tax=Humidisolicoccus flavus TaxID=3111414 RepID=UPI0032527A90
MTNVLAADSAAHDAATAATQRLRRRRLLLGGIAVSFVLLFVASLSIGGYDITLEKLLHDPEARAMFFISRIPRTLALCFAGVAMCVSGVIMQVVTQNKFVEPTTAGTTQWAGLGILIGLIFFPAATPLLKMVIATGFAFVGTMVFIGVIRGIKHKGSVLVPLVGIMLGAVVGAATLLLASENDLLQSMSTWRSGGFSSVVRGFYEPLWAVAIIAIGAWFLADRLTIIGLGKDFATNVGVHYERVVLLGVTMVALAAGVTSVVVGFIPFLGLIVPNLISMSLGDDARRNLPWVALTGASLLMACDIVGRLVVAPMEIPASVILGVIGAVVFIGIMLRQRKNHG